MEWIVINCLEWAFVKEYIYRVFTTSVSLLVWYTINLLFLYIILSTVKSKLRCKYNGVKHVKVVKRIHIAKKNSKLTLLVKTIAIKINIYKTITTTPSIDTFSINLAHLIINKNHVYLKLNKTKNRRIQIK